MNDGLRLIKPAAKSIRLVLTEEYGRLRGVVCRGRDVISPWSTYNVPANIVRFLAANAYYESSPRYFETFLRLTDRQYPIVYREADGTEIELTYRDTAPQRACLTFAINGTELLITRTLDGSEPIPLTAVLHGDLLINLDSGEILPVSNRLAWRTLDEIINELEAVDDQSGYPVEEFGDYDFEDDEFYDHDTDGLADERIRRIPNGIAVDIELFNAAAIRINPALITGFEETVFFLQNDRIADTTRRVEPAYLLDIPAEITNKPARLTPLGMDCGQPFPFSNATFWFFNPMERSRLSAPMRTKKRVRTIMETCFALVDVIKPAARNALIRTALSTPDYGKRAVKREAKQILSGFAEQCGQRTILIRITADGWRFVEDDRQRQAKTLRIIFEMFGAESFTTGVMPGEAEVQGNLLMAALPGLLAQLQENGFTLRMGSEQVQTAAWEFALDATNSSMDWFELKPEIRCDGVILSDEELRSLLEGNTTIMRDGRLLLLDELNAQIMSMFAGTVPNTKKRRKGQPELVRVPRLQILDWLQLRSHGVTVKLAPEDTGILDSLLNFAAIPDRSLPARLNATLRHYQVDAWRWLAFLYEHRFGACLADDMGLGKTIQGITLLAGLMGGEITSCSSPGTPHLIVVPPSLLFNWEAELARFLPTAKVSLYTGTGRSMDIFTDHDVVITSYGIIQRDIALLETLRFDLIIFDETQVVKNLQAATSNAVRRLKGAFVLALTGTPVENHLGEYYAIMDLCLPGLLGSREQFARQVGQGGQAAINTLVRRTRPFVLRRSKQMIAAELPPKIETDIPLELDTKQRTLYQRTVEEVRSQVAEAFANHSPGQARIIALTAILRLRQICLAPALAAPGASRISPKLEFLIEQLQELRDEGHSALVFSQFTGYLDIIEKGLEQHGLSYLRLDGSTPVSQRKTLVNAFQNSVEPAVFLISLKAGGKGLNLTRATYVFHMDPWWNPAVENQASDRAHRIGQTGQVTITRLIMRHTIEEKMMALKARKLQLYRAILDEGDSGGGAGLTRDDFEFLLGT